MSRLWRLLKSLTKLRIRLLPPRHTPVLLYFASNSEIIAPYFSHDEFQILDLREHEVNIFVALLCLVDRNLGAENYALRYIGLVKPKLVITLVDNFPAFYRIKNHFPDITTILMQNGIRSDRNDLFGDTADEIASHENHVDYMFVFGSAIGDLYSKHIEGEILTTGSLKNNSIPIVVNHITAVSYISTYRSAIAESIVVRDSAPGQPTTYQEILRRRDQVVIFLANYCKRNHITFTIIGKDEHPSREQMYYSRLLMDHSWTFIPRTTKTSSYNAVDNAEIVVFTSSTLGYEALARGKKTAAFLIDAEKLDSQALKFGWPAELPDDGPFWTHQLNEQRFEEILDYLRNVSSQDWENLRTSTISDVINFDAGNSQFVATIKTLRAGW